MMTAIEEIFDKLTTVGFHREDNKFIKVNSYTQTMTINGQDISRDIENRFELSYLGEGTEGTTGRDNINIIYGFDMIHNDYSVGTLWVHDWQDLIEMVKIS